MAKDLEKICLADEKVSVSEGSWCGTNQGERLLVNSNGFVGQYKSSNINYGVYAQGGIDGDMISEGWSDSSRNFGDLDPIEAVAERAIARISRLVGATKIESQKIPMIMEPNMTASLLRFLVQTISGNSIYMKRSFLVDKMGEKIASDIVNIVDDGLMPGAPGTRPFDGEGVPTRKNNIVKNGVLSSYLLSSYSARKLGMKTTGNASGANNLYMVSGKHSFDEMVKSIDKGFLLVKTIGQGTVPTTGDINKGAYGLMIEKGELTRPVREITFTGNLAEMLKNISMIGNDNEFRGSISGPSIKIDQVNLSGK